MTTHTPDERPDQDAALDRLRAADPARDAAADLGAIEARVRARVPGALGAPRTGDPVGDPGRPAADGADAAPGTVDELAARRRRRAPLLVAAGVAGVLAVGAGGYALGATGGSGVASDTSVALAPIELSGTAAQEETAADATAGVAEQRLAAGSSLPGWWGGRTVFHQDGLSTAGASAPAWAYDAAGVFSAETARRVAAELGVEGEVREEYGAFVVGSSDWTGPVVSLQPDGLASVSFSDPTKDPWGCAVVEPAEPTEDGSAEDGGGSSGSTGSTGECVPGDQGTPPGGEEAAERLRALMRALGVDPDGFEVEAQEPEVEGAAPATTVTASEVVDGRRTGTSWSATFSGAGLASVYGALAPRVEIGTYDVVSPAEAVERLGDPRFGAGGPVTLAREGVDVAVPEIGVAPDEAQAPTVPPTVAAGERFAWPVTDVTITGAVLGSAVQHQPDGAAVLVPAYELTDAEGSAWSVVGVVDDQLDFSPLS
ncbi:hypothetical protein [Cellulosimicrobium marinum]|uniref:hypothetical protein n=1 Tax=Cellulosimicrobium marinum TaxID=1638992 RepID=UPI001E344385|nr:hypothetical protein [Cellulosimicrobium marinum]MCB7136309.1 hypothetical protein [Cellulosimicrobium marinum]